MALELLSFDCYPVFLSPELKQTYYQGELAGLACRA